MGLLDALSPALTVATDAAGAYQNAEAQADATKRQGIMDALTIRRIQQTSQIENALHEAQTGEANARADYYAGRTPDPDTTDRLRSALIGMGRDPDTVDAMIAAARMGPGGSTLRTLLQPPKTAAPRVLSTSSGYMTLGPDGTAQPITSASGAPVMPLTRGTGAGAAAGRALAETPAHREARQNFNATETQLRQTASQLRALDADKRPLVFASPADSVAYDQRHAARPDLAARMANLSARADSLAAAMGGNYSVPGTVNGTASNAAAPHGQSGAHPVGSRSPANGRPITSTVEQQEYQQAARAFQAAGGPSNPDAQRTYNRIVAAIAQKYQRNAAGVSHITPPSP